MEGDDGTMVADLKGRLSKALFGFNSKFASHTSGALVQVWLPEVCADGTVVLSAQGLPFAIAGVGDLLALFRCVSCRYRFSTDVLKPGLMGAIGRVYASCEPEMSHNVQKYDKQVYLRVTEAQRCRVHSTLVMPIFASASRTKPVAVFELVQSDKGVVFPDTMTWLRSCLADVSLFTTESSGTGNAAELQKWPMDVEGSLLDEFGTALGAASTAQSSGSAGRLLPENDGPMGKDDEPGARWPNGALDRGASGSFTSAPAPQQSLSRHDSGRNGTQTEAAAAGSPDGAAGAAAAAAGPSAAGPSGGQQLPAMQRHASAPLLQAPGGAVVKMEAEATAESEGAVAGQQLSALRLSSNASSKDLVNGNRDASLSPSTVPQQQQGQAGPGVAKRDQPSAGPSKSGGSGSGSGSGTTGAHASAAAADDGNTTIMQALQRALQQQQIRLNEQQHQRQQQDHQQQQQQQQAAVPTTATTPSSTTNTAAAAEAANPALLNLLASSMQSMLNQHAMQAFRMMQEQLGNANNAATAAAGANARSLPSGRSGLPRLSSRSTMATGSRDFAGGGDDGDEDFGSDGGGGSDNEEHDLERKHSGMQQRPAGAGRRLTYEDLQAQFGTGLKEAAVNLGVCATTLKRACRRNGITRWPRRQIAKLSRTLNQMGYSGAPPPSLMQSAAVGNLSTTAVLALGAAAGLPLSLPSPGSGGLAPSLMGPSTAPQAIPGLPGMHNSASNAHLNDSFCGGNSGSLAATAAGSAQQLGNSLGSFVGPSSAGDASATNPQLLQQTLVHQPMGAAHSFPGAHGVGPGPFTSAMVSGSVDASNYPMAFSMGGISAPSQAFPSAFGSKGLPPPTSMAEQLQQQQQQQQDPHMQQGFLDDPGTLGHLDSLLMQDMHDPNPHSNLDSFLDMISNDGDDLLSDMHLANDGQLSMLAGGGGGFVSAFGSNRCGLAPIAEGHLPNVSAAEVHCGTMDIEVKAPLH